MVRCEPHSSVHVCIQGISICLLSLIRGRCGRDARHGHSCVGVDSLADRASTTVTTNRWAFCIVKHATKVDLQLCVNFIFMCKFYAG